MSERGFTLDRRKQPGNIHYEVGGRTSATAWGGMGLIQTVESPDRTPITRVFMPALSDSARSASLSSRRAQMIRS